MNFMLARLKEVSTWQGIIAIATGCGVMLSPEMQGGIIGLGVAVFAFVSVILAEKGSKA
jgi:hypothetical protein